MEGLVDKKTRKYFSVWIESREDWLENEWKEDRRSENWDHKKHAKDERHRETRIHQVTIRSPTTPVSFLPRIWITCEVRCVDKKSKIISFFILPFSFYHKFSFRWLKEFLRLWHVFSFYDSRRLSESKVQCLFEIAFTHLRMKFHRQFSFLSS